MTTLMTQQRPPAQLRLSGAAGWLCLRWEKATEWRRVRRQKWIVASDNCTDLPHIHSNIAAVRLMTDWQNHLSPIQSPNAV